MVIEEVVFKLAKLPDKCKYCYYANEKNCSGFCYNGILDWIRKGGNYMSIGKLQPESKGYLVSNIETIINNPPDGLKVWCEPFVYKYAGDVWALRMCFLVNETGDKYYIAREI